MRQTKCTNYSVVIYKLPTGFGPHWSNMTVCTAAQKQSLGHIIISNVWHCGKITNV